MFAALVNHQLDVFVVPKPQWPFALLGAYFIALVVLYLIAVDVLNDAIAAKFGDILQSTHACHNNVPLFHPHTRKHTPHTHITTTPNPNAHKTHTLRLTVYHTAQGYSGSQHFLRSLRNWCVVACPPALKPTRHLSDHHSYRYNYMLVRSC